MRGRCRPTIGGPGWTKTRDLVPPRATWWRHVRNLVVLAALGATACAPQVPWRVGFLGGLSGRVSDVGLAGRDGARLALDQVNARGGIAGRQVELIVRDHAQHPEHAQRAIDSCDRGTSLGLRDRAVLLLLARLGLRAHEVIAFKLQDCNWDSGSQNDAR